MYSLISFGICTSSGNHYHNQDSYTPILSLSHHSSASVIGSVCISWSFRWRSRLRVFSETFGAQKHFCMDTPISWSLHLFVDSIPGFRHSRQGCCKLLRILVWTFISSSLGWTTRSGTAESEGGGGFFHHFKKLLDCLYEVAVPFHIPGSSARGLQWFVSYSDLSVLSKLLNLLA